MIRLTIFVLGAVTFLAGAASNFERIPLPFDLRAIDVGFGFAGFTLDVILMVVGVFLMAIAWIFHKLNQ